MISALAAIAPAHAVERLGAEGAGLAGAIQRAGLVDVDGTIFVQALFFFGLMLILPKLIFRPMLDRIEQREARTEGARAEAKAIRHAADEQVSAYETATSEEKRRALAERADARSLAQRQAAEMINRTRTETSSRIDAGIRSLREDAAKKRTEMTAEAQQIARQIADKLAEG